MSEPLEGEIATPSLVKTKTRKEHLVRDRRKQITDGAIRIFEIKGFHGATVREIGAAAGLTQGTIYNYVESKDDILFLVCDRIVSDYEARLSAARREGRDAVDALRSVIRAVCKATLEHQREVKILFREHHHLKDEPAARILARLNEFITDVEQVISNAASKDSPYNDRFACNVVTFLPTMFALRNWVTPPDMSKEEQIDQLAGFLHRGLGIEPS